MDFSAYHLSCEGTFRIRTQESIDLQVTINQRQGIITVLFLAVVGMVFGCLSFSFFLAQLAERRVTVDAATDAGSFALASQAAQGLNFISSNNLAIAATIHISTATVLLADDVGYIITTLMAKPSDGRSGVTNFKEEISQAFELLRPIAQFYLASASGLTALNNSIRAAYPYTGIPRAFQIARANQPGSIVIPFKSPGASAIPSSSAATPLFQKLRDTIKSYFSVAMRYDYLVKISAADTFCLSIEAGRRGLNASHSKYKTWFLETDIPLLSQVLNWIGTATSVIRAKLNSLTLGFTDQAMYEGCGVGESESAKANFKNLPEGKLLAVLLKAVLTGPLSGRYGFYPPLDKDQRNTYMGNLGSACGKAGITCLPPFKFSDPPSLSSQVNTYDNLNCKKDGAKIALEATRLINFTEFPYKLAAVPSPFPNGTCYKPQNSTYQTLTYNQSANQTLLADNNGKRIDINYKQVAIEFLCHGEILFKYGGFAGFDIHSTDYDNFIVSSVNRELSNEEAERGESIGPTEAEKAGEICPNFIIMKDIDAVIQTNPVKTLRQQDITFSSNLELKVGNYFMQEVINDLNKLLDDIPTSRFPFEPGSFREVNNYLGCADGVLDACENTDRSFGTTGVKFFPGPKEQLKWLCPVKDYFKISTVFRDDSYNRIKVWHNSRIDSIDCTQYLAYKEAEKNKPVPPPPQTTDFCSGSSDLCWHEAIKKLMNSSSEGKVTWAFLVPDKDRKVPGKNELLFDSHLQYSLFMSSKLRTRATHDKNKFQEVCPPQLAVTAKLSPTGEVPLCDTKYIVGLIERQLANFKEGKIHGKTEFGTGSHSNTNLASGGELETFDPSSSGFRSLMGISQSKVIYDNSAPDAPAVPPAPNPPVVYRMFWPAWRPEPIPSRLMSRILGPSLGAFFED